MGRAIGLAPSGKNGAVMQTITVSSLSGLYAALASATGGETIALAPGNYGNMFLGAKSKFDITFPSNVTITSADPGNPAVFTGLDIRDAANLTFDSVVFDYTFAEGQPIYTKPFKISGGENITIRNSTFDGDVAQGVSAVDDGFGYGQGLSVRGTNNVTIEGNEFYNFHRGLVVGDGDNIAVTNNEIHSIRSDGMNFTGVQDVLIEGNYIHDFRRPPSSSDHADMIQFWTNGTTRPTTDVTIRGNILDIGEGSPTQSIFMRNDMVDRGLAGPEMFYRNVTIEDNLITNAHAHGITVGETAGLVIRQNSVLHADGGNQDGQDASVEIPRISVAGSSTDVTITGNVTAAISGATGQPGWSVRQNAYVQDQNPLDPGYYGDVFVSSSLTAIDGVHQFLALPGGMIDRLNAGATPTREMEITGTVTALFQVSGDADGSSQTRVFDASLSSIDTGSLPAGTIFEWSFGDGSRAQGRTVTHDYADGGRYDVSLTVILPGGARDSETTQVAVQDSTVLSLGDDGLFRAQEFGDEIVLAQGRFVTADGIQLGNPGVAASVARQHVSDILSTENFDISMEIKADVAGTRGEIFRLHGSIIVEVNTKGELFVRAFSTEGDAIRLTTTGVRVNDLRPHDIGISLEDGRFSVSVDGRVAAESPFNGTLVSAGTHGLVFGNPWNAVNFKGDLEAFEITAGRVLAEADVSTLYRSVVSDAPTHRSEGMSQSSITEEYVTYWKDDALL